jgi:hypothetical protein
LSEELRNYIYERLAALRVQVKTLEPYAGNALEVRAYKARITELELILRRF